MRAVPRREFLPPERQSEADLDVPLSIGHGATNSQPTTVRAMLDLLAPELGDRVLDVGAGSGWTTALLTWLVGPTGRVEAVERVPELARFASARLAHPVHLAEPGVLGWPAGAPYDRILVSAEAAGRVPPDLVDQLAVDARPDRPNLALFDIQVDQRTGVGEILRRHEVPVYGPRGEQVLHRQEGHPFTNLFQREDLTPNNPVFRFAFSPQVLDRADEYFGGRFVFDSIQVLYSWPTEGALRESQMWHKDYGDWRSFHCVAYVNDVLAPEDVAAIRAYVLTRRQALLETFPVRHLDGAVVLFPRLAVGAVVQRHDVFVVAKPQPHVLSELRRLGRRAIRAVGVQPHVAIGETEARVQLAAVEHQDAGARGRVALPRGIGGPAGGGRAVRRRRVRAPPLRSRRGARREGHRRRCRVGARTLREADGPAVLPGGRISPSAPAVLRP